VTEYIWWIGVKKRTLTGGARGQGLKLSPVMLWSTVPIAHKAARRMRRQEVEMSRAVELRDHPIGDIKVGNLQYLRNFPCL
jgi:hypothetical protein